MVEQVMDFIEGYDKEIGEAIKAECGRQRRNLELIASENIVSEPVMAAMGTVLTNKYAEGYSGKRYYGGCEFVDVVETIAIERAKKLFGCDYVNVQPHSGAQANMAVFVAMLKPGDTVMGMNLDHGGHLTHGSPVNFSGLYFNIVPYGVNEDGYIDYDKLEETAVASKPKLIIAGASAYCRTIDFKRFREVADKVGADGGYGSHRRAGGGRCASQSHSICGRGNHNDPQDLKGSKGRHDSGQPGSGRQIQFQ